MPTIRMPTKRTRTVKTRKTLRRRTPKAARRNQPSAMRFATNAKSVSKPTLANSMRSFKTTPRRSNSKRCSCCNYGKTKAKGTISKATQPSTRCLRRSSDATRVTPLTISESTCGITAKRNSLCGLQPNADRARRESPTCGTCPATPIHGSIAMPMRLGNRKPLHVSTTRT